MASFTHPKFPSSACTGDRRRGADDGNTGGNQVVGPDGHGIGDPYRHGNQREDTYQIMQPDGSGQSGLMTQGAFGSNPLWDVSSTQKNVSDPNGTEPTNTYVYGLRTSWDNSVNAPRYGIGSINPAGRNWFFAGANAALITGADSWENNSANMPVNTGYDHTSMNVMGYGTQWPPGYDHIAMNAMGCATPRHPRENSYANIPVNAGYDHTAMNVMGYGTQLPPGYDHAAMNSMGTAMLTQPSLHAPPIRTRDFSSSAEFERDSKKLKIPCKYHAKGWCVRGNSCRFLHVGVGSDYFGEKVVAEPSNVDIPSQESGDDKKFNSKDGKMALHEDHALVYNPLQFEDSFQHMDKSAACCTSYTNKSPKGEYDQSYQALACSSSIRNENFYGPLGNDITGASNRHEKMCYDQGSSEKIAEMQLGNLQEERLLDPSRYRGKGTVLKFCYDNKLKLENMRQSTGVSGSGKSHETNIQLKIVDPFQLESKALKCFRAALIEYVKELLEPAWLEGLLPKDIFKLTVKKSVEKILGSFQPEQIPPSSESIKRYISSCQVKIDNLVQAYLERSNLIWICWKESARRPSKKLYHLVQVTELRKFMPCNMQFCH